MSLSSFINVYVDNKETKPTPSTTKASGVPSWLNVPGRPITNDPIRFIITANKQQVSIGEEIELSVTARLMNISPNLLFFLPGSNAYTLRILLPIGFQQTGGDLTEFVTGELTQSGKAEATYTVRGYFTSMTSNACFRLLRSHGQANSQSLFVEKATFCLPVHSVDKPGAARMATTNSSLNWCAEAESGSGNRGAESSPQASGGQSVGGFGNSSEYMNYTIGGVSEAGNYTLHLYYTSGETAQFGIVVNGNAQTASGASNGSWTGPFVEKTVAVNLQAGNNSLRIQGAGGSFTLDRLCVNGGGSGSGCKPPILSLGSPTCAGNNAYSVSFSAQAGTNVSSSAGSVQGNQVVNIPTGVNATITASLNGCSSQQTAYSPTCNSGGNPPSNGGNTLTKVRFYFRNDNCGVCRDRCAQSQIQGSTDNVNWTTLAIIPFINDGWNEVNINNSTAWRYVRYQSAGGCYGELMELEFYNGSTKLSGTPFGSPGINASMNYTSLFDGNLGTLWHGSQPGTHNFAGLDVGMSSGGNPSGCGTGNGLTGFYTNTTDLSTNLAVIRTDAKIDFAWGNDSPMTSVVNADGFSVRWYGQVEAPVSGVYTFKTNNDDGTRLWVNDQLLIDDWNGHPPTWKQGSIYLTAGQKYPIEMVFVDYGGGAQAQLYWEYPGQSTQIVPSCRLYTSFSPTEYTIDPIANAPQPYGFCSVNIDNWTFFLQCYTGKVVDISYFTYHGPGPQADPIKSPGFPFDLPGGIGGDGAGGSHHYTLPAGGSSGGGPLPGPWHNPGVPIFNLQTGLSAAEISLNKFYASMLYRGISFTNAEKAVIAQYPNLMVSIRAYVDKYGSKPDGSNTFILSDIDQLLYPKFTNLVKNNIRDYVMYNPKILNALKTFSGFNEQAIRILLAFGKGPRIIIKQIPNSFNWMEEGYTYGYFKYNENPNAVNIDYTTVRAYENENNWPELEKAWFVLLANLLIHETAHYGAFKTQTIDVIDGPTSMGPHKFDIAAFGYAALPGNVIDEIVLKNGK